MIKFVVFILVMAGLAIVHEFGHFVVARLCRVKVLRFALGFGKPWFRWRSRHCEYVIAPLLLGGYVKMLDNREVQVLAAELTLAFDQKSLLQRLAIVVAGPLANLLVAVLAFWILFLIGVTTPKPILGKAVAGIPQGAEITKVDGVTTLNWQDVVRQIVKRLGTGGKIAVTTNAPQVGYVEVRSVVADVLQAYGIVPYRPLVSPVIGDLARYSPAMRGGLKKQDRILAINGMVVNSWDEVSNYIKTHPRKLLHLRIMRKQVITISVTTAGYFKVGYLGIKALPVKYPSQTLRRQQYAGWLAGKAAIRTLAQQIYFNALVFQKIITGKLSFRILGGPIAILQTTRMALQHGVVVFIEVLGMLSLALGFINLLPLPGLDGGHCVMLLVEAMLRRPIPARIYVLMFRLGMIGLGLLVMQITINDLRRIFL